MIVRPFRIELLGALKPLLGEVGLAFPAEGDGDFEGRSGPGFGRAALFDAALVVFVGDDEFALGAFVRPIAERGYVGIALSPDGISPDPEFLVFRGCGLGGTHDAALFVDPNSRRDVGELIGGAGRVSGVPLLSVFHFGIARLCCSQRASRRRSESAELKAANSPGETQRRSS